MDEKLTAGSLEKTYAQAAPSRGTFGKEAYPSPRQKCALAGVFLTLGPGRYGLLRSFGAMENTPCVE